ncbi:Uncharacterised protein [Candidatus Bilamarchaeum dharawalense]|uniref:Uncharacterized protein n=1 Tax=Candidatus Bilamarchaeum dharawalense TaxID=2885759 RepID=A0A5E4LMS9_9ARCH|nr:Uncharacterised protein [Candidatus Bilamarchaeum dharawalense]
MMLRDTQRPDRSTKFKTYFLACGVSLLMASSQLFSCATVDLPKICVTVPRIFRAETFCFDKQTKSTLEHANLAVLFTREGIDYIKEYSQRTPRFLKGKVRRNLNILPEGRFGIYVRAINCGNIYLQGDNFSAIAVHSTQKFDCNMKLQMDGSTITIPTSKGTILIKIEEKNTKIPKQLMMQLCAESTIAYLYSVYLLDKAEALQLVKEIYRQSVRSDEQTGHF